jgi:glucosamine--fructose-6-phosphate aminotransferase (isomerizing)
MRTFKDDMAEQPAVLSKVAAFYASTDGAALLEKCKRTKQEGDFDAIIVSGMGSSYAASRLAAHYLWSLGVPAMAIEASELLHYGMDTLAARSLVILISQSGESAEVVQILQTLPSTSKVLGITNERASTLGRTAAVTLPLFAGEESTTSSKTYTASLAVTLLACGALAGRSKAVAAEIGFIKTASRKLSDLSATLSSAVNWDEITQWLSEASAIYLIGRGPAVTTAFQGALTFKELVKVQAECMEAAQFRHGPLETVDEQTIIFAFASAGKTSGFIHSFIEELLNCGAKVIVIEEGALTIANADAGAGEGGQSAGQKCGNGKAADSEAMPLDEYFSVLADIYPVQMAAQLLSERLETSGAFKWITKVTRKE